MLEILCYNLYSLLKRDFMNAEEKLHYLENLSEPVLNEVYEFAKTVDKKSSKRPPATMKDVVGTLKDSPHFKGDLVKLQKKIRREWG